MNTEYIVFQCMYFQTTLSNVTNALFYHAIKIAGRNLYDKKLYMIKEIVKV